MDNFDKAQQKYDNMMPIEHEQNYDSNGNPIGCDKTGKCTARGNDECWRYSESFFFYGCEYADNKECWNCHIRSELGLPQ